MSAYRDFPHIPPFALLEPAQTDAPFLFNSPHAGRHYPQAFMDMSCLDAQDIRLSEDRYVDLLFECVTEFGATFMRADFPRAYLDVNREAHELDPNMFYDSLPAFVSYPTARVQSGLGCVPRNVAQNKPIYQQKLPAQEAVERISSIYHPYHAQLKQTLRDIRSHYGYAVLIDCHSMPGELSGYCADEQPDIILGDLYGRTCAPALTHYATLLLTELGYRVGHNQPYAGGYITTHYGRPAEGFHALQIEINRTLYLDQQTLKRTAGFEALQKAMRTFAQRLVTLSGQVFPGDHLAAE